jgi:hypothetical protein
VLDLLFNTGADAPRYLKRTSAPAVAPVEVSTFST